MRNEISAFYCRRRVEQRFKLPYCLSFCRDGERTRIQRIGRSGRDGGTAQAQRGHGGEPKLNQVERILERSGRIEPAGRRIGIWIWIVGIQLNGSFVEEMFPARCIRSSFCKAFRAAGTKISNEPAPRSDPKGVQENSSSSPTDHRKSHRVEQLNVMSPVPWYGSVC